MAQAVFESESNDVSYLPAPLDVGHERTFQRLQIWLPIFGTIAAAIYSYYYGVPWGTFATAFVLAIFTGLGITVGFHRLFTHRSFETVPFVRGALAIFGSMAAQGTVFSWVSSHRQHHRFSDKVGDPHSPNVVDGGRWPNVRAALHAHFGWMLEEHLTADRMRYIPDLIAEPLLVRIQRLHLLWVAVGFAIPAAVGWLVDGTMHGVIAGVLWGGFARIALTDNVSFAVNSVCHLWGARPYDAADDSRNNLWVALLSFGEGWHNNHHAFPTSARHGLNSRQPDTSYAFIRLLERCGLAWNVKTPTAAQLELKARSNRWATESSPDDAELVDASS